MAKNLSKQFWKSRISSRIFPYFSNCVRLNRLIGISWLLYRIQYVQSATCCAYQNQKFILLIESQFSVTFHHNNKNKLFHFANQSEFENKKTKSLSASISTQLFVKKYRINKIAKRKIKDEKKNQSQSSRTTRHVHSQAHLAKHIHRN